MMPTCETLMLYYYILRILSLTDNRHFSGSLGELSVEELKSILNDEDHFEAFLAQVEAKDQPLGRRIHQPLLHQRSCCVMCRLVG